MTKKGFSMLEILLTLCIVGSLLLVSLSYTNKLNLDHLSFMDSYERNKCDSLLFHRSNVINKGVSFNSDGNVNKAKTIEFNNHKIIIHLGNGYITYE